MSESKKIHLSNFTGSSVSVPGGMPGKAKAAKGFGAKMTAKIHAERGQKTVPKTKGEKVTLKSKGPVASYKGKPARAPRDFDARTQGKEVASVRKVKRPKKGK